MMVLVTSVRSVAGQARRRPDVSGIKTTISVVLIVEAARTRKNNILHSVPTKFLVAKIHSNPHQSRCFLVLQAHMSNFCVGTSNTSQLHIHTSILRSE